MRRRLLLPVVLFCLWAALPLKPAAMTVYLKEYVVTRDEKLTVGGVASVQPGAEILAAGAARQEIPSVPGTFSLIPAAYVKNLLAPWYPEGLAVVGQQTAVIPEKMLAAGCQAFVYQLLKFLEPLKKTREHRLDFTLLAPASLPGECRERFYTFTLPQNSPASGILALRYTGKQESVRSLEILVDQYVPVVSPAPGVAPVPADSMTGYPGTVWKAKDVKTGDTITIVFYKGNIRLKTDGLAYASGFIGDTISVKPSTAGKRFQAQVTGIREVRIEIR